MDALEPAKSEGEKIWNQHRKKKEHGKFEKFPKLEGSGVTELASFCQVVGSLVSACTAGAGGPGVPEVAVERGDPRADPRVFLLDFSVVLRQGREDTCVVDRHSHR